ncbi:hypothetical protein [Legionella waltersii]|uniref:Ras-GEF domain-containing protein n=1 Tax=Legionella waltersii TaxID=66969 RepID=A0A0W1A1C3_9GAMM|nr:hypothetical protein [Legionella waltersii]KTD75169.1 hypothetical protein Lwal_3210 [Legionella waltersii]SNV04693.1 Uncharacterised protein [Legionella waltersii]
MSGKHFRHWLDNKVNDHFWNKPLASRYIDKAISDKKIQRSISASKQNQIRLSCIESIIASDYARMIDVKLRELYKSFRLEDFKDPSGFEKRERSNLLQQDYFQTRGHIEYFIKKEIYQNDLSADAQLNAFRRWINIADLLLRRHCYEGFLLVIVNLELISNKKLIMGLPEGVKNNFAKLCALSLPDYNHSALRKFMSANQDERDFTPMLFNYHAITVLNESLSNLISLKRQTHKDIKRLSRNIIKLEKTMQDDPSSQYDYLLRERGDKASFLSAIKLQITDQFRQRKALLSSIKKEQGATYTQLPDYLVQTYRRLRKEHTKYQLKLHSQDNPPEPPSARDTTPSQLYKSKLLPSFWARSGKPPEKYWDEFFIPSILGG